MIHKMKVFFQTYGCSYNQEDTDIMKTLLRQDGSFEIVNTLDDCDVVVVNGCIVKDPTEHKIRYYINNAIKQKKRVVLAGCFGQVHYDKFLDYTLIGTNTLNKIVEAVNAAYIDDNKHFISNEKLDKGKLIANLNFTKKAIQIIPIEEGCLGNCTYCFTKFARSNLKSVEPNDIIKIFRKSLDNGVKEFWLTGQDTGCYGLDVNTNIVELLNLIISTFKDEQFFIRLGMMNPNYALKYLDELIEIFKDDHMFKFIHIPVQSCSDKILKLMNRHYKSNDFIKVVKTLKTQIPKMTIMTDIIVGFPQENENDFNLTFNCIKEFKPTILNISRFWSKKGTLAFDMVQVPKEISMSRSKQLYDFYRSYIKENQLQSKNDSFEVYFNEKGKNEDEYVGRNIYYNLIIVKSKDNLIGLVRNVKVAKVNNYYLLCDLT